MMNTDTLIIIIIFSILGAIFSLFVLIRIVKALSSTSNPLPLPQPLAHHREQDLARFHNGHAYQLNQLSSGSLLGRNHVATTTTTYNPRHSESGGPESSLLVPAVDELGCYDSLPLPPNHFGRPSSSSSLGSASTGQTSPPPERGAPITTSAPSPIPFPRPRVSSSRPRPLSVSSTFTTSTGAGLNHSIAGHSRPRVDSGRRGLPHGPHSQMHIILPPPLAPDDSVGGVDLGFMPQAEPIPLSRPHSFHSMSQPKPYSPLRRPMSRLSVSHAAPASEGDNTTSSNYSSLNRRSMVDKWLATPVDTETDSMPVPGLPTPSSSNPSTSSPSPSPSPSPSMMAQTQSQLAPKPLPPPPYHLAPPPHHYRPSSSSSYPSTASSLLLPINTNVNGSATPSSNGSVTTSSPIPSRTPSRSSDGPKGPRQKNVLRKPSRPEKVRLALASDEGGDLEKDGMQKENKEKDGMEIIPQAI